MVAAAAIGAGISALGSIGGALASNALSTYEMQQMAQYQAQLNYKYWKKQMLNQPKFARQGLEAGGYNPMLAIGNMSNGTSNWSSLANPTTPDLSTGVSNALGVGMQLKQQENQNNLANAQVNNYNADSVLKSNQALTEMYTQLEKINHADLMQAQKLLTDKNVSWYDKQQAREDLRVANEIERTGNEAKIGMANAIANQVSANANVTSSNAGAYDIYSNNASRYQQQKEYNTWASKHPYLKSLDQTLTRYLSPAAAGVGGAYAGSKMPTKNGLKKPLGFK